MLCVCVCRTSVISVCIVRGVRRSWSNSKRHWTACSARAASTQSRWIITANTSTPACRTSPTGTTHTLSLTHTHTHSFNLIYTHTTLLLQETFCNFRFAKKINSVWFISLFPHGTFVHTLTYSLTHTHTHTHISTPTCRTSPTGTRHTHTWSEGVWVTFSVSVSVSKVNGKKASDSKGKKKAAATLTYTAARLHEKGVLLEIEDLPVTQYDTHTHTHSIPCSMLIGRYTDSEPEWISQWLTDALCESFWNKLIFSYSSKMH